MSSIDRISSLRNATAGAVLAATGFAVAAAITIADPDSQQGAVQGVGHVSLGALSVALVALVPMMLRLGRMGEARRAAVVACTGQAALALLATTSNVHGADFGVFPFVAIPANLMILGGWTGVAVGMSKRSVVSGRLAATLPVSFVVAMAGSRFGAGLLVAAYWLAVTRLMHRGVTRSPRVDGASALA